MKIIINGNIKEYYEKISLSEILEKEDIIEPIAVEVFVNGKRIDYEEFDKIFLKDGDEIEYVYLFASG